MDQNDIFDLGYTTFISCYFKWPEVSPDQFITDNYLHRNFMWMKDLKHQQTLT
jgi:hypothetical protein